MFRFFAALALSVGVMLPTLAQIPGDIPMDHWARPALTQLQDKYGLQLKYPDGSFRGDRTLSRYEMAALVAQMLTQLDQHLLSAREQALIQKLQQEFASELENIQTRLDNLEEQSDLHHDAQERQQETLSTLQQQLAQIRLFGSLAVRYCIMSTRIFSEPQNIFTRNLNGNNVQMRLGAGLAGDHGNFDWQIRILTNENDSYNLSWFPFGGNHIPRAPLTLDRFMIAYEPTLGEQWSTRLTFGKAPNPFLKSELLFDEDVSLTGATQQLGWRPATKEGWQGLQAAFAEQVLLVQDTSMASGMLGARLDTAWKLSPEFALELGSSYVHYLGTDALARYNFNQGYQGLFSQRNRGTNQGFDSDFHVLNPYLELTWTPEGIWPLRVIGDGLYNFGAADRNRALGLEAHWGNHRRPGDWELIYALKWLEQDANLSLMVDENAAGTDVLHQRFEGVLNLAGKTFWSTTLHVRHSLSQPDVDVLYILYTGLRQDF